MTVICNIKQYFHNHLSKYFKCVIVRNVLLLTSLVSSAIVHFQSLIPLFALGTVAIALQFFVFLQSEHLLNFLHYLLAACIGSPVSQGDSLVPPVSRSVAAAGKSDFSNRQLVFAYLSSLTLPFSILLVRLR